jgi:HD-GYP domain-containing protein (c-di-GMP phosphodiesterase class II)
VKASIKLQPLQSNGLSALNSNQVAGSGLMHELSWIAFPNSLDKITTTQVDNTHNQLLPTDLQHGLISIMDSFWEGLKTGSGCNAALANLAIEQLVGQLVDNADQLYYVGQLAIRDRFTQSHTLHVASLSVALGLKIGLSSPDLKDLGLAAILHDIGKLYIPRSIMFKPGRLSETEFEVMKLHPEIGYNLITRSLKLPKAVALPALQHQEMWGGGGYPNNCSGNDIHLYSQIVKIADVYDALTAVRPYKSSLSHDKAMAILQSEGEKSFNPQLLAIFCNL